MADLSSCVSQLQRVITDLETYINSSVGQPQEIIESSAVAIEHVYRSLLFQESVYGISHFESDAVEYIRNCLVSLQNFEDYPPAPSNTVVPAIIRPVGRPRFEIPVSQLKHLIENHFTVPQIARLIGVSPRTIHRRMSENGLSISSQYSELTDVELDAIVGRVQQEFPNCGNTQMSGHLLHRGIRVQQHRIRESQRRVDPSGVLLRQLHTVHRRKYKVPGPRCLYHIDGNHKLIR